MNVINGFRTLQSLGLGATSEVFLAEPEGGGAPVALKVFNPSSFRDPQHLHRLETEHEAMARLAHPNILRTLALVRDGTRVAIALEYMDGGDLRGWLVKNTLPLLDLKLWILVQIARGLGAAHECGILHRDLKPENVLLNRKGAVKLTDFGIAKFIDRTTHTQHGLLVGSLGYLAPEIINGKAATAASDIFSFSVLAYEVLTGKPPFSGETAQEILSMTALGRITPLRQSLPSLHPALAQLFEAGLASRPELRPQSIWRFEAELMSYLQRQGMFPQLRESLAADRSDALIAHLFGRKRDYLLSRMQTIASETPVTAGAKEEWLSGMHEFSSLFPGDLAWEDTKSVLRSPHAAINRYWYVALIVCFLLALAGGVWQGQTGPAPSTVQPSALERPAAPSLLVQRPATQTAKATPQPGSVRFHVPSDVTVFLDDVRVQNAAEPLERVRAGKHKVRMVKEGFVPIENEITVRPGQEALIRVGAQ